MRNLRLVEPQAQSQNAFVRSIVSTAANSAKSFIAFLLGDLRVKADYLSVTQVLRLVIWHRTGVKPVVRRSTWSTPLPSDCPLRHWDPTISTAPTLTTVLTLMLREATVLSQQRVEGVTRSPSG